MENIPDFATRVLAELADMHSLIPTYIHLLGSAIFPIYIASHASLSRPKSAPKPPKTAKKTDTLDSDQDQDQDDDDEKVKQVEGFSPSDAIVLPVTAGLTLSGLYFLIKWLEDPAILNKILGWYFGLAGAFAVSSLLSDSLRNIHAFTFPALYRRGSVWYRVNGETREARNSEHSNGSTKDSTTSISISNSPLPGWMGNVPLPASILGQLWNLRTLADQKYEVRLRAQYFGNANVRFDLFDIIGITVGISASLYANIVSCPWWLTNILGTALSYGALQMLSPTTFATGSAILSALFVYDIVMVFYTPMMVKVATSLDVPIKLMFPQPSSAVGTPESPAKPSYAMLGLGDVVLPGMMIGLALRFDLYLYYLYKQRTIRKEEGYQTKSAAVHYVSPGKHWGSRFWTSDWLLRDSKLALANLDLGQFPKPYFHAAMTGYIVGMITTLISMQISHHPQPALLYLVPGVLGALWVAALARGEHKEMWQFSEAAEEDDEAKKDKKPDGTAGDDKTGSKVEDGIQKAEKQNGELSTSKADDSVAKREDVRQDGNGAKDSKSSQNSEVMLSLVVTKVRRRNKPDFANELLS